MSDDVMESNIMLYEGYLVLVKSLYNCLYYAVVMGKDAKEKYVSDSIYTTIAEAKSNGREIIGRIK